MSLPVSSCNCSRLGSLVISSTVWPRRKIAFQGRSADAELGEGLHSRKATADMTMRSAKATAPAIKDQPLVRGRAGATEEEVCSGRTGWSELAAGNGRGSGAAA